MKGNSVSESTPTIPPVAKGSRPLWSVMIPTYNCARQARKTLASVMAQAPEPDRMEIMVVDDASDDDIAEAVAYYGGRITLHRQPRNLGVPANLTEAIRLSRGRLVHLLHGDDLIDPGFYHRMEAALEDEQAGAAYCRYAYIDQHDRKVGLGALVMEHMGRLPNALRFLAAEQRIMTPSICVRRAVYERLGGFHSALHCAEDWEMWVRIARHYPVVYVPELLARYRMQPESNTGRNVATGRDVYFNKLAIKIIRSHLPAEIADEVTGKARRTYARSALGTAEDCARRGDMRAAVAQLRAAVRLDHSLQTVSAGTAALVRIATASLCPKGRA